MMPLLVLCSSTGPRWVYFDSVDLVADPLAHIMETGRCVHLCCPSATSVMGYMPNAVNNGILALVRHMWN